MKRFVLWSFVLVVVFCNMLPSRTQQAAQHPLKPQQTREIPKEFIQARKERLQQRREQNPHEGLIDLNQYIEQVEQNTKAISAKLPAASSRNKAKSSSPKSIETFNNLIDKEIFGTLNARGVKPAKKTSDEEFCRRVFLDITGHQPSPQQLLQYIDDKTSEKKEKLIDELVNSPAYVDFWTLWFGDLTNNFTISRSLPSERDAQYKYLRSAIEKNTPYNQIAKDIIAYKGDIAKGPATLTFHSFILEEIDQDSFDEIATQVSSTFLGTQSACISCHNGEGHLETVNLYFSTKKRSDFWGLSAFFAKTDFVSGKGVFAISNNERGEYLADTIKGDKPPRSGGIISPSYKLFSNSNDEAQPNEDRRQTLARILTNDPQFARAFVNRVFARFFTLGLVEPLNGFDLARLDANNPPPTPWTLQPSHPVLLNNLSGWFVENGYDIHKLIKLIVSSQAYALSSSYEETAWKPEYTRLFARKLVRRLQAEEVLDAITNSTQVPALYYVRGFPQFNSALALPGVEEPILAAKGADDPIKVTQFLSNFGRGDRNNLARSNDSSITQALDLFNSDLLINRLDSSSGLANQIATTLEQGKLSPEDAIKMLYLNTLARQPTTEEINKLKEHIKSSRQAVADVQWLLFNRPDFSYNY